MKNITLHSIVIFVVVRTISPETTPSSVIIFGLALGICTCLAINGYMNYVTKKQGQK